MPPIIVMTFQLYFFCFCSVQYIVSVFFGDGNRASRDKELRTYFRIVADMTAVD